MVVPVDSQLRRFLYGGNGSVLYMLYRCVYFATYGAFSDEAISCRISSTEVIYRW